MHLLVSASRIGGRISGRPDDVAIDITPLPGDFLEAADLVQTLSTTAEFAACDELHGRMVWIEQARLSNAESKPAQTGRVWLDDRGSRIGMPGFQQIVRKAEYVRTVARPHQRFGRWRLKPAGRCVPPRAAKRIGRWKTTVAGGGLHASGVVRGCTVWLTKALRGV